MMNLKLTETNLAQVIQQAVKVIRGGGLIIAPTDTVYGALVDAKNKKAVEKLMEFKSRPAGKAISIFVSDLNMLKDYVEVNTKQEKTLDKILPGPFTVILPSKKKTSGLLEAENGTLGVRLIQYTLITQLVSNFGSSVTATSANMSGKGSSHDVKSFLSTLSKKKKDLIDLVIDGGKLPRNKPSTVVDLTQPKLKIIRAGDISPISEKKFVSNSVEETKKIAKDILVEKIIRSEKTPIVFILEGDLGVGKTVFVKGMGAKLGINDIISPTYVIYYEYDIKKSKLKIQNSKFVHIDLYNLQEEEEFEQLKIENYLIAGNILCIEWGERAGKIFDKLKEKGEIVYVELKYLEENKREINIL